MGHDGYTGEGTDFGWSGEELTPRSRLHMRTMLLLDAKRGLFDRLRSVTWFNAGEPDKLGQMRQEAFEDYRMRTEQIFQLLPRDGAR